MKYSNIDKPPEARTDGPSFPHAIEIHLPNNRFSELEEFLAEHFGAKHRDWRAAKDRRWARYGSWYTGPVPVRIRFAMASEAMRFKLAWS